MAEVDRRPRYRVVAARSLRESVVDQITGEIVSGALKPGDPLPTEAELTRQFGVSRTVIREAVRVLVEKGLIAVRHGSGMQVQPTDRWDLLDPTILFEHVRVSRDDLPLVELLELRRMVEVEVAALAATRRTDEDLSRLRRDLEGMRGEVDSPPHYTDLDVAFHDAILVAAHNRYLRQVMRPISDVLTAGRLISSHLPGAPGRSQQGHEEIFAAIEARDAVGAREAMHRHILQFEDNIRSSYLRAVQQNTSLEDWMDRVDEGRL